MTTDTIPMGEAVSWGWDRFRENALLLIIAQAVAYALPSFVEYTGTRFAPNGFVESLVGFASTIVTFALQLGIINIVLRIHDGKPVEFGNLFDQIDRAGWYFLAMCLMLIAVGLGLLLFVVPGVIIALRLVFVSLLIVDERSNALDAFQRSWDVTRGFTLDLFLFGLLLLGINILGVILFGVGVLVTAPISWLALAYVYRRLTSRYDGLVAASRPPAGGVAAPPS